MLLGISPKKQTRVPFYIRECNLKQTKRYNVGILFVKQANVNTLECNKNVFSYSNAYAKNIFLDDDLNKEIDYHYLTETFIFFTNAYFLFPVAYPFYCQLSN